MMTAKVGAFAKNKFTNAIQQSTISLTWPSSASGSARIATSVSETSARTATWLVSKRVSAWCEGRPQ